MILTASEVQVGDYLVGLGDGYVIDVDHDVEVGNFDVSDRYNSIIGDGFTVITFNDQEGCESYVILAPANEVEVQR